MRLSVYTIYLCTAVIAFFSASTQSLCVSPVFDLVSEGNPRSTYSSTNHTAMLEYTTRLGSSSKRAHAGDMSTNATCKYKRIKGSIHSLPAVNILHAQGWCVLDFRGYPNLLQRSIENEKQIINHK